MNQPDIASLTTAWSYPTTIRFGAGSISGLADACRDNGIARPLLVTDPGLARLPVVEQIQGLLRGAGLKADLFTDVRPNPVGANIEAGVAAYRAGDHDGVIAMGGGSGLDAGKCIAFMQGQSRPIWDFEDIGDWWTRADGDTIAPIIAVPTTAGTGSEVGRAGVITDEASHTKKIIFHPKMLPAVAILDAGLTMGLPPHLTAGTGMDALAHCLEAYCAPSFHPMGEGIAVEGIRLIKEALPQAYAHGDDLAARGNMLAAAAMGAIAFQKGLGAMHALSHPIGAMFDTHHGLTNAVVMPYVLAFNRPAVEAKIVRLAAWLGLPDPSFDAIMTWILQLRAQLAIPHTLNELGVAPNRIDELAEMAAVDLTAASNPVPVGAGEMRQLYAAAMDGQL